MFSILHEVPFQTAATLEQSVIVKKKKLAVAVAMKEIDVKDTVMRETSMVPVKPVEILKDTATLATIVPPKPRFRIAHINEINLESSVSTGPITSPQIKKPFLATVTTSPAGDRDKIVQKKKYPLSFPVN